MPPRTPALSRGTGWVIGPCGARRLWVLLTEELTALLTGGGASAKRVSAPDDRGLLGIRAMQDWRVSHLAECRPSSLQSPAPSSLRTTRRLSKASPGACPGAFSGRYDAYQLPTNPGGVLSRRRKGARVAALVPPVVCFVGDGREDPMIADDKWPVARLIPISSASGVEAQERRLASALRAVDVQ